MKQRKEESGKLKRASVTPGQLQEAQHPLCGAPKGEGGDARNV